MARFLGKINHNVFIVSNHRVKTINSIKYEKVLSKLDKKCRLSSNYDKLEKLAFNAGEICYPKFYLNNPFTFD